MSKETRDKDKNDMKAAYHKLARPGAPHALLTDMEGSWNTLTRSWMMPGQPPVESRGVSEQKIILGGRFLYQEFKGEAMGAPFTGIGIIGYDNHKKKFVSTWMDSMSTGMFHFEGDGEGKTITMTCSYDDPVRGPMKMRTITRIEDKQAHRFEMYGIDAHGKEEKIMEITYTKEG